MGKSTSVVTGYRYFMGLHFGVCYGPVDALREIRAGDRQAWIGEVTDNETIAIDAEDLFGGEKREGGLEGDLDVMMGGPAQTANAYLSDQISGLMPAFRGILSLVYNGGLIACNNPYVKPWAFLVERIKQSWHGGTAWNPTKAAIPLGSSELVLANDAEGWDYQIIDHHASPGYTNLEVPDDGWTSGAQAPFAGGVRLAAGNTDWPIKTILWTRMTISVPVGLGMSRRLSVLAENGCVGFVNGEIVGWCNRDNIQIEVGEPDPAFEVVLQEGTVSQVAIKAFDETSPAGGGTELIVTLSLDSTFNAMNPAHIIYQCLTDPHWGMGYPTAQIDDASFTEAALTFFDEGLGLCMIWNNASEIEDFIQIVLDHAGAVYYADPKTGKFKLKALRADYDADYLPVYDESNIISVDNFQRPGYGETVNEITVVYREYGTAKDSGITVQDLANIQAQGGVVSATRQYPGLPTSTLAARIAERDLIASSTPLARCRITVNRSGWAETPGNVIKVNWDKLGLEAVIFRVLTINYGTLTDSQLVIELAEDVYGLPSSSYSVQEPTGFTEPDITPSVITIQDVAETPYWNVARALTAADLSFLDPDSAFIMAMASTTNEITLGFEMFTRISPAEYASAGGSGTFAPTALVSGSNGLRQADTILEYSDGINVADVAVGQRALIGTGRFAEYVEIAAIGSGMELELNRGILDTTPQDHAFGARIFFNESDFAVDITERATGDSVDVKLSAFSGGGVTGINGATAMNIEPDQRIYRPYPPGKVRINDEDFPTDVTPDSSGVVVTWAHRDRLQQLVSYVDQDEDSIGPEAGTTYTVRFYLDSTLLDTQTGITGTTATYDYDSEGLARVEVESVRNGVVSWQAQIREFNVFPEIETDPYFDDVVALLHFNGTDGSTTFTDEIGPTWNGAGNAQIDTAQSKWGGASLLLDGTGDFIATDSVALLTTADFTLEGWIRANALGTGDRTLWAQYTAGQGTRTIFDVRNTKLSIFNGANGTQSGATTLVTGQWYHVAFVRVGTTCEGYLDGVLEVTHTNFAGPLNTTFRMGSYDGSSAMWDGWFDDFRCTVGTARYTTDFTPPDGPFPDQ